MVKGLTVRGVPPQPAWLLYVKIAILFLSVVILGLSAYACSVSWVGAGVPAYMIFLTLKTLIIYGGVLFVEFRAQHFFFRIGAFVLYLLGIIFWLSGWAWAASWAGLYNGVYSYYGYTYSYSYGGTFGPVLAAIAGLGALLWILTIVNFVVFVRACLADPEGNGAAATTGVSGAELGAVKQEPQTTTVQYPQQPPPAQQYPQQPQGQYPQQQYPQQQYPQQTYPQQQYPTQ